MMKSPHPKPKHQHAKYYKLYPTNKSLLNPLCIKTTGKLMLKSVHEEMTKQHVACPGFRGDGNDQEEE